MSAADLEPATVNIAILVFNGGIAQNTIWELDDKQFPSLPNRPAFTLMASGEAYTNIPAPKHQRHRQNGAYQKRKRW